MGNKHRVKSDNSLVQAAQFRLLLERWSDPSERWRDTLQTSSWIITTPPRPPHQQLQRHRPAIRPTSPRSRVRPAPGPSRVTLGPGLAGGPNGRRPRCLACWSVQYSTVQYRPASQPASQPPSRDERPQEIGTLGCLLMPCLVLAEGQKETPPSPSCSASRHNRKKAASESTEHRPLDSVLFSPETTHQSANESLQNDSSDAQT